MRYPLHASVAGSAYGYGPRARVERDPRIGDLIEFLTETIPEAVSDVFDAVPGSEWLKQAYEDGKEWLVEYAQTDFGRYVLNVIAGGVFLDVMRVAGPWIASLSLTAPGLIAGESFTDAYLNAWKWRIEQFIAFFDLSEGSVYGVIEEGFGKIEQTFGFIVKSTNDLLKNPDFQRRTESRDLRREIAALRWSPKVQSEAIDILFAYGLTDKQVARDYGVRQDVAAAAIDASVRLPGPPDGGPPPLVYDFTRYDIVTGKSPGSGAVTAFKPGGEQTKFKPGVREQIMTAYGGTPSHIESAAIARAEYDRRAAQNIMGPGGLLTRKAPGLVGALVGLAALTSPLWVPKILSR